MIPNVSTASGVQIRSKYNPQFRETEPGREAIIAAVQEGGLLATASIVRTDIGQGKLISQWQWPVLAEGMLHFYTKPPQWQDVQKAHEKKGLLYLCRECEYEFGSNEAHPGICPKCDQRAERSMEQRLLFNAEGDDSAYCMLAYRFTYDDQNGWRVTMIVTSQKTGEVIHKVQASASSGSLSKAVAEAVPEIVQVIRDRAPREIDVATYWTNEDAGPAHHAIEEGQEKPVSVPDVEIESQVVNVET